MNKYDYRVTERLNPEFGITTYGIAVWQRHGSQWTRLDSIEDISINKASIVQLAERCQRLQLDAVHLKDVVLDHIS